MQSQTAVIVGASGLTGSLLLQLLLEDDDFSQVTALVRRTLGRQHPKLQERIINFGDATDLEQKMPAADYLFCCIGTTTKKVQGDKAIYRSIDYDIPVHTAQAALAKGCKKYMLVSAIGADAASSNFYLKLKGEVEVAVSALPFDSIHLFQPSILMGSRKEFRLGELIGKAIMPVFAVLLFGGLRKFKPIQAATVAKAMVAAAKSNRKGVMVHQYDDMLSLAK